MSMQIYQIILAGVGGQGILTLSELIGEAALKAGLELTGAETHGMAQRGGSVIVHLRLGTQALAPLVTDGQADLLVSLELAEALRYVKLIKRTGTIITSTNEVIPTINILKHENYPSKSTIINALRKYTQNIYAIDFRAALEQTTGLRPLNIAILGAIAKIWAHTPGFQISESILLTTIKERWPSAFELNQKAFEIGLQQICSSAL